MDETTKRNVDIAMSGMMYASDTIDKALLGQARGLPAEQARYHGPFVMALDRIAEIADGAPIEDKEKARIDLLFLFSFLHHLRGGFYSALWDILARAHVQLADMITEQEAKDLLGKQRDWFTLDLTFGYIHPIIEEHGLYRTYDATFLGNPASLYETVQYARHEIEARKKLLDETYP